MSTKGLLTILFFFSLIGIGTGIAYSASTKDGVGIFLAVFVGIPLAIGTLAVHSELR